MKRLLIILLCSFCFHSWAQNVVGNVSHQGETIEGVNVSVIGSPIGTSTNKEGDYSLAVSANRKQTIAFSYIGYKIQKIELPMLKKGQDYTLNIELNPSHIDIDNVNVEDEQIRKAIQDSIQSERERIAASTLSNPKSEYFPGSELDDIF